MNNQILSLARLPIPPQAHSGAKVQKKAKYSGFSSKFFLFFLGRLHVDRPFSLHPDGGEGNWMDRVVAL